MAGPSTVNTSLSSYLGKLVCVTKPYCALQKIRKIGEYELSAEIKVENTTSGEPTLISVAEAGRHLAILGSYVLAMRNPLNVKHYYLANKAILLNAGNHSNATTPLDSKRPTRLIVKAKVISLDLGTKAGSASTEVSTSTGEVIFTLDVYYQILKADLFQKLFKKNYNPLHIHNGFNPYTQVAPFNNLVYTNDAVTADFGIVTPEQCVGHFDYYPALPIAILCSVLVKLGIIHFKKVLETEDIKYSIKQVSVSAVRLAFAGERVLLHSSYVCKECNVYTFYVKGVDEKQRDWGNISISIIAIT